MRVEWGYQVKSNDGNLCYVGRCGNKIVRTPLEFRTFKMALGIAKSLMSKTDKPHFVFSVKHVIDDSRKKQVSTTDGVTDVDSVNLAPFDVRKTYRKEEVD